MRYYHITQSYQTVSRQVTSEPALLCGPLRQDTKVPDQSIKLRRYTKVGNSGFHLKKLHRGVTFTDIESSLKTR